VPPTIWVKLQPKRTQKSSGGFTIHPIVRCIRWSGGCLYGVSDTL